MASPPVIEDPSHASRRAKVRIGIAVALLATAVGILAVLNQRQSEPAEEPEAPVAAQESMSSAETEPPPAPEETSIPVPPVPEVATPEVPAVPPPPPVAGQLPPAPNSKPQPTLASEQESSGGIAAPAAKPATAKPVREQPVKEQTFREQPAKFPAAQSSAPALPAAKPLEPKAFEVQLGVFTDMENAKLLQSKLAEHGIPSHTETRVQIGPFKTRAEADQARARIKALGVSSVIVGK